MKVDVKKCWQRYSDNYDLEFSVSFLEENCKQSWNQHLPVTKMKFFLMTFSSWCWIWIIIRVIFLIIPSLQVLPMYNKLSLSCYKSFWWALALWYEPRMLSVTLAHYCTHNQDTRTVISLCVSQRNKISQNVSFWENYT